MKAGRETCQPPTSSTHSSLELDDAARSHAHPLTPPSRMQVGAASTGYLKVTVAAELLGEAEEDGMTEVSGMTGFSKAMSGEQDLSGERTGGPRA